MNMTEARTTTAIAEKLEKPAATFSFEQFQVLRKQAEVMIASRFLPPSLNTPEKVISVAMAGRELGIGFMASLRNIYPIQGVPTISPRLMLALAIRSGDLEDWNIEKMPTQVRVMLKRKGKLAAHYEIFGDTEAQNLGLLNKDNYKKQKLTMFKWRALSAAMNFVFPDILMGGMYTPEELGADVTVSEGDDLEVSDVKMPEDEKIKEQNSAKVKCAEIIAGLSETCKGEMNAMAEYLADLTSYPYTDAVSGVTVKRWIELDDLPRLAVEKPAWINRLYEKIMPKIMAAKAGE